MRELTVRFRLHDTLANSKSRIFGGFALKKPIASTILPIRLISLIHFHAATHNEITLYKFYIDSFFYSNRTLLMLALAIGQRCAASLSTLHCLH